MRDERGRLLRTFNRGEARLNAYLEDHAYLLEALLRPSTRRRFEARFFELRSRELADAMIERFADPEHGGFFTTSNDHEELIARRKDLDDHPAPSGNSSAARGLLRLAALSGEARATRVTPLTACSGCWPSRPRNHPEALAYLLGALDLHLSPTREIALIVAPAKQRPRSRSRPLVAVVRSRYRPGKRCSPPARGLGGRRRCSPTAPRSRAVRPPTSASASPAQAPVAEPRGAGGAARRLSGNR